jgi:hypothetical protein
MSQNYDTTIYKGDDDYDYQGLAAIQPVVGPERNGYNQPIITAAVNAKDPNLLDAGNKDQRDTYDRILTYLEAVDAGKYPIQDSFPDDEKNTLVTAWGAYRGSFGDESSFGLLNMLGAKNLNKLDEFYGGTTSAITDYGAQLQSNAEEMIISIISGAESLDYFDDFVAQWKANGGDEMTAQVNEWYQQQ